MPPQSTISTLTLRLLLALLALACALGGQAPRIDGARAMRDVEALVAIGPRSSGSRNIETARLYIEKQIEAAGLSVSRQSFNAQTPAGALPMTNLIVRIPGSGNTSSRVLLTGHYDTKRYLDRNFTGANDGGSSTALLLEFARILARKPPRLDVWIVFFDGEEATGVWTDTDSLYGSRHLAHELRRTEELSQVRALINVDMIGDRDLQLANEYYSHPRLKDLARETARAMGKARLFDRQEMAVEDDHLPFARLGVPTLNLIDFSYGPDHSYWHSEEDTVDKLAAASFVTVGELVLGILERLEAEP